MHRERGEERVRERERGREIERKKEFERGIHILKNLLIRQSDSQT